MPATQIDVIIRPHLLEQLAEARRRTDELFAIVVKPDSLYERPIAERHRIIFYIGHLEAFDWNLFHERVLGLKSFHPELDRLFAFGIDPVGGGLPNDQPSEWPSIAQVRDYVEKVRELSSTRSFGEAKLARCSGRTKSSHILTAFPVKHRCLNVAIEHRLMHAETLAYMLHQLPLDRKIPHNESLQLAVSTPIAQFTAALKSPKVKP